MTSLIELQDVQRVFHVGEQDVYALNDVNLRIEPGEYLSIMGPSGSGKSTLLNLLGLLDKPSDGRYLIDGQDVTRLSDVEQAQVRQQKIGFVFQAFHLVPRLTAAENVALPMMLAGIEKDERDQRVQAALQATGLADRAHHRPEQLSGGQRQRVAVARATIMRPGILLADEPTGNLDQASGREIVQVLEDLNQQGLTLLVVTHDPELGQRARRQVRFLDGRIVHDQAQVPA
jgi:putative ABC transport system ATP-binding protein